MRTTTETRKSIAELNTMARKEKRGELSIMDPSTEVGFLMSIIMGAGTLLKLGGVVVGILLLASIFGLALAGQKFLQFRRASPAVVSELDRAVGLWHKGEQKEARELLIESELTVATDIRFGLEKHGTMNPDLLTR